MSKVSFIVSAFNRPPALRLCLSALILQTEPDWDAIIMDNGTDPACVQAQAELAQMDPRIRHYHSAAHGATECYEAGEMGVELTTGEWVCFPSDDSYYVPQFVERMLYCAELHNLQLVLSDMVWGCDRYHTLLEALPQVGQVDKTSFLVRRDVFIPFPGKVKGGASCSDGLLIEELAGRGVRWGRVQQPLVVHN